MLPAILAALMLATPDLEARPLPVKLPAKDQSPIFRPGLPGAGAETAAPAAQRFFGIGIGFQDRGTAQGVPISRVIAGSPADRAGLTVGTVIAEIGGTSTLGRSEIDCIRMVKEAGDKVTVKYYDPATLKLRTRTLEKEWFVVPN
jgi:C-terminal processing protease CtpA/Prc